MVIRVPVFAVIFAVIATALCVESATFASADCPAGDKPTCVINKKSKINVEKYPHPNSCQFYFLCTNGVPHCVSCGEDQYYDPATERCGEVAPEGCKAEPEPTPTEPPVTDPPATDPPVTDPPATDPPVTDPPATDPPVTYPPATEPPVTDPPATEPPVTDPPATEPPVTDPPATEPPPTEQPEECPAGHDPTVPKCPVCLCDGTTFKHPYDCQWYYECENNVPVLKHCEGGFHWNENLKICDYPCLAGCQGHNNPEPTPEPSPEPTPEPSPDPTVEPTDAPAVTTNIPPTGSHPAVCPSAPPPDCPANDPTMAVYFPHPTSCSYFFECTNGIARCMPCSEGLYFSTSINACDFPAHSGCNAGP